MSADTTLRLAVRTVPRDTCSLAQALAGDVSAVWLKGDEGLVGLGVAAKLPLRNGLDEAASLWESVVARAEVDDAVHVTGTGLIGFVSAAFTGEGGWLVIPARVVGRRDGVAFETTIEGGVVRDVAEPTGPGAVSVVDGAVNGAEWRERVEDASARIRTGDLSKVVLAAQRGGDDREPRGPAVARWEAGGGLPRVLDVRRGTAGGRDAGAAGDGCTAGSRSRGCWPVLSRARTTRRQTSCSPSGW